MLKYSAIGCNESLDYAFCLPICARFFKHIIGYKPIALLVRDREFWAKNKVLSIVLQALNDMDGDCVVEFVGTLHDAIPSSSIAQSSRQHSVCLPWLNDDDLLIPGDADLLPFDRAWHNQHDPKKHDIALYYVNGCGNDYMTSLHFPTCYTSMKVGIWREIMGVKVGMPLNQAILETFNKSGYFQKEGMDVWFQDQVHASNMIARSKYFPKRTLFIERSGHPPVDRIDRGGFVRNEDGEVICASWPERADTTAKRDAHLPRPPYSPRYWPSIRDIISQVIPDRLVWADYYHRKFMEAMK